MPHAHQVVHQFPWAGEQHTVPCHLVPVQCQLTDTDSSNSILRKRGRHVHRHQKTPPAKDYNVLSGKLQVRKRWQRLVPAKDYNALSGLTRSNQNTPQRATTPCWHLEPRLRISLLEKSNQLTSASRKRSPCLAIALLNEVSGLLTTCVIS